MRLRSLLAAAFAVQVSAEPVILYDGNLRSLPEDQGWIYRLEPPVRNHSRSVLVDGAFNLNTSRNLADRERDILFVFPSRWNPIRRRPKCWTADADIESVLPYGFSLNAGLRRVNPVFA